LVASRGRTIKKMQKMTPRDAKMTLTGPRKELEMQSGSTSLPDWPLLEWHRVFDSRDAEEIRTFLGALAFRFDLAARDTAQLEARVSGIYLPGIYLGRAQYGAPVAFAASPIKNDYWVHVPIRGMWEAAVGHDAFVCDARHATVSSPTREVVLRCNAGAARVSLSLTSDALKRQLAALLGEPPTKPIEFAPTMNLADGYGRRLAHMLTSAVIEFERKGGARWSLTTMIDFSEYVLTSLLLFHRHNYSDTLGRSVRMITPRDVKRVVDYLEAHLDSPITVANLVAASRVAGRTLFQHFRDVRGMSPMRYLRNARFAKVRDTLLRAEPEESVTMIAMGCGFTHMGRFAVEYRHRFGERPSDTLYRDRRGRENACGEAAVGKRAQADGSVAAIVQGRHRLATHGRRERAAVEVRRLLLHVAQKASPSTGLKSPRR
jgi:AraC-like DNA-binding protein